MQDNHNRFHSKRKRRYPTKKDLIVRYLIFWTILVVITLVGISIYTPIPLLYSFIFAINFAAFGLFGFDKSMSTMENSPRIPELFFQLIALFGGSIGIVVGSQVFRHKTLKMSFMGWIYVILILQIVLGGWVFFNTLFSLSDSGL